MESEVLSMNLNGTQQTKKIDIYLSHMLALIEVADSIYLSPIIHIIYAAQYSLDLFSSLQQICKFIKILDYQFITRCLKETFRS